MAAALGCMEAARTNVQHVCQRLLVCAAGCFGVLMLLTLTVISRLIALMWLG